MNLIGKIFTVLIFVMSLVFMAFVLAVYATHTNWYDVVMNKEAGAKPLGLQYQVQQQEQRNTDLKAQLDKITSTLESERADKRQALAKLESEKDVLQRERDDQMQRLARAQQDLREAVATMNATQDRLTDLENELKSVRTDLENVRKDRQEQFAKVVELTDQLHQAVNQQKALEERNKTLAADYAKALEVLRKFELEPDPARYTGEPWPVDGLVSAVRPGGMLELNIGSDDGLMKGHKLEVFRTSDGTSTYLGRVEVTDVSPNQAVAKVVPEFLKGAIQVGDRVKSNLK